MGGNASKSERMRQIRRDRKSAGFREVTVWVPADLVEWLRASAWGLIDNWNNEFPHKDIGRRKSVFDGHSEEVE